MGIFGGLTASVLGLIFDGRKKAAVAGLVLSLGGAVFLFLL